MTEVRLARPQEYDEIGELTAAAYVADGVTSETYLPVIRDAATRAAAAELLVAAGEGGELVGSVTLVAPDAPIEWRRHYPPGAGSIRMLGIAPSARRRGLGRLLTQACIDRARERGWTRLCLLTDTRMLAAQALYPTMGFSRDESLDIEVEPGVFLIGYSLPLP